MRRTFHIKPLGAILALCMGMQVPVNFAASDFYIVRTRGRDIGTMAVSSTQGADGVVTEIKNISRMTRQGLPFNALSNMRFVENGGSPIGFDYDLTLGEQSITQANGQVVNDRLAVEMTTHNTVNSGNVPIAQHEFLFPAGKQIENLYKSHAADMPGNRFTMQTLHMGMTPSLVSTEVTVAGDESVAMESGETRQLKKFALQNAGDAQSLVYEWRDDNGKLYKAVSAHDGMEMIYALQNSLENYDSDYDSNANALDVIEESKISTNRIAFPRQTYTGLYRLSPLPGKGLSVNGLFPKNRQQWLEKNGTESDVFYRVKRTQPVNVQIEFPVLYDKDYLTPTALLQSDNFEIANTARTVVGKEKRAYYAAAKLRDWVNKNIANKTMGVGFESATETMRNREGDCSEHAVLLAALVRSLGIPSRVAVGLVYVPEGNSNSIGHFVFHMWTEIYLGDLRQGEWFPLDATFAEREMDATHVKLFDTALSNPRDLERMSQRVYDLMGKLRIDVVEALAEGQSVISLTKRDDKTQDIPKIDIQRVDLRKLANDSIKRFRVEPIDPQLSLRSAEGLLSLGIQYLANDEYDKAISTFKTVSSKIKDGTGHYKFARQLLALELYGLANQEFGKAASADPSLREAISNWTQVYMPRGPLTRDAEKLYMEGINEESREKYTEALAIFNELAQGAPEFAPVYLHIGASQLENDEPEEALSAYQTYSGIASGDPRGPEGMALAYMQLRQHGQAVESYRQALALARELNVPTARNKARAMEGGILVAQSYGKLGQNKNNAQAWLSLGKGLYNQDNHVEARKAFGNAARLSPGLTEARLWEFKMLLGSGQWLDMKPLYSGTISRAGTPMGRTLKGHYEMRVRNYPLAEATLKQAIAGNPAEPENYDLLAQIYVRLSELAYRKGSKYTPQQYRGFAVANLQKGIARVTSDEGKNRLRSQLAQLIMESDPQTADAMADDVLASGSYDAYTLKGRTSFHAGNLPEAERHLKKAVAANGTDVTALKTLGDVYRQQGRISQALYQYQEALSTDPNDVVVGNTLLSLIEENKLSVKKPTRYWVLSDDERDYIIQLNVSAVEVADVGIEYYERVAIADEAYGEMTVSSNLTRPQVIESTNQYFNKCKHIYEETLHVVPPKRFIGLQQAAVDIDYNSLLEAQYFAENDPMSTYYESLHNVEKQIADLVSITQRSDAANAAYDKQNEVLSHRVPAATWTRLELEGGGNIEDKMAQLEQAQDNFIKKYISIKEKAKKAN